MPHSSTKVLSKKDLGATSQVVSARLSEVNYKLAAIMAELSGYESMSQFMRDAVLEKVAHTARGVTNIALKESSTYKEFDPTKDF